MRPVNLVPPEERRGDRAPSRTGALPYVIVGLLACAVAAVAVLALTNKQIDDRKAEKTALEAEEAQARATAEALAPYAEFAQASEARVATVTSLAESRFDWVRVLKELSLVLPDDVWLTTLNGSVSSAVTAEGKSALAEGLDVPTLSITGCATGHDAVAAFVETLKDIDGVTRVGVTPSERGIDSETGTGGEGTGSCRTREFIAGFELAVAFDAAAVPAAAAAPAVPPAPADEAVVSDPQVADAQQQEQEARDSASEQTEKAHNSAEIIPGVTR
jgi:Tfp pilus assembly protein PilN